MGFNNQDSTKAMKGRHTIVEGSELILTPSSSSMCTQSIVHRCFVDEIKCGCCDRESDKQPCAQQQNTTAADPPYWVVKLVNFSNTTGWDTSNKGK